MIENLTSGKYLLLIILFYITFELIYFAVEL